MDWYVAVNNQAKIMPESVLVYKIKNHEISGETLVVNAEIKNWTLLKNTDIWKRTNNCVTSNNVPDTDAKLPKQQAHQESISPENTTHSWRCNICGNMISKEPCAYCDGSYGDNKAEHNTAEQRIKANVKADKTFFRKEIIITIISTVLPIVFLFIIWNSQVNTFYYVVKMPNFSAGTIKVDGYMHKSKTCCQAVANRFGAEVIRVRPKEKAGINEYGQVLDYEDAFNYCPICCN